MADIPLFLDNSDSKLNWLQGASMAFVQWQGFNASQLMESVFPKSGLLVMTWSLHLNTRLETRNLARFSFPFRNTFLFLYGDSFFFLWSLRLILGVGQGGSRSHFALSLEMVMGLVSILPFLSLCCLLADILAQLSAVALERKFTFKEVKASEPH